MGCSGIKSSLTNSVMKYEKKSNKNENEHLKINKEGIDEITLKYKSTDYKKGDKIKLFGEIFVKNNKDKCKIVFNKTEYELVDYFELPEINNSKEIEIKLKGVQNITNISGMFSYNYKILSSPDISKWNTINITDMSRAFNGCFKLSGLSGISKWNTQNVTNFSEIFANCEDIETLPDISNWNTEKATNMNKMFSGCIKLKSLPDISKWKTNNVTEMQSLFERLNL